MRPDDRLHQTRRESTSTRTGSLTASAMNRLRRRRSTDAARQDPKRPRPADQGSQASAIKATSAKDDYTDEFFQSAESPSAFTSEAEPRSFSLSHDVTRSPPLRGSTEEEMLLDSELIASEMYLPSGFDALSEEAEFFDAPNELSDLGDETGFERPSFLASHERARITPVSLPPSPPLPPNASADFGDSSQLNSQQSSQLSSRDNEANQVSVLSRVLLAAATLTASHLVGEQLSHGEQYGGSGRLRGQRSSPHPFNSPANAVPTSTQDRSSLPARGSPHVPGHASVPETEFSQTVHGANAREDDTEQATQDPVSFLDFLEQLRSGGHTLELWQAMFDTNRAANFFRFFRFPEDGEGRIPILLMGIRSAERGNSYDREQNENADSEADLDQEEPDLRNSDDFEFPSESRMQGDSFFRVSEEHDQYRESSPLRDDSSSEEDSVSEEEQSELDSADDNALIDAIFSDLLDGSYNSTNEHNESDEQSDLSDHNLSDDDSSDYSDDIEEHTESGDSHDNESDDASIQESARRGHHSWVIYVIGGAYPPNHPIFFAPSLLTDSPSYEDMLFVEQLLGPIKPPVASMGDVFSAGGIFTLSEGSHLLAERCPICLVDYAIDDVCRELNCKHAFHQDCVDSWLTKSHNSCPMCRQEGVPSRLPNFTRNST